MRILYLVEWDAFHPDGVTKKLSSQVSYWASTGCHVALLCLSPTPLPSARLMLPPGLTQLVTYRRRNGLANKVSKSTASMELKRQISSWQPDIVYMRQTSWTPFVLSSIPRGVPLVTEVNSDAMAEARLKGFGAAVFCHATHHFHLRRSNGFVCVSNELTRGVERTSKPTLVLANGVDVPKMKELNAPRNRRPALVFAGTPGHPWHGLDEVLLLAAKIPEFDFHIAGVHFEGCFPNVFGHGYLDEIQLSELTAAMDVGISTLALYRNGMNEASPLKSRNYLAHGLPVIGGYRDTDLSGEDFFLEVPNRPGGLLDARSEVIKFVHQWKERRVEPSRLRALIGNERKEEERLRFFTRICT